MGLQTERPRRGRRQDPPHDDHAPSDDGEWDPSDDRSYEREWEDRFDLNDFDDDWLPEVTGPEEGDDNRFSLS